MAYTSIDNPEIYFQTKLYNGSNSSQSITLDGDQNMQPDWVWIKSRNGNSRDHCWYDSVRGVNKRLQSNTSDAEDTTSDQLTSFDSNGFSMGVGEADINSGGRTYVAWNWKAGTSVSGTTGGSGTSKSYSGSVNTDAGISIIAYTGNSTAGHTVPHHLGVAPQVVLCKRRGQSGQWTMGHEGLGGFNKFLELDLTSAEQSQTKRFNDTAPSSTVFTLGSGLDTNADNITLIAYSFAEKKGYSKFGKYEGNGSTDGPAVVTGFKPAWVMVKNVDSSQNWAMFDNKRPGFNVINDILYPNNGDQEESENSIDFLSYGFKIRASGNDRNGSGNKIIYMAFAEAPFVNSNGLPTDAG
tara:strand:- start:106 stop:1164 length:1059 start_codon:yes stop_codon:yes gene_type:complete